MSLKNIELQVALPRSLEQSRNQQLMQHQTNLQNAMDAEQMQSQTTQMEETVADMNQSERTEVRDRQGKDRRANKGNKREMSEEIAQAEAAPHPYKGHRLDIKM